MRRFVLAVLTCAGFCSAAQAGVLQYGDRDLCNTGTYSSNPTAGATLEGLTTNARTFATNSYAHSYPFSPTAGDYPGTDQIYVGSQQTGFHDGYSQAGSRLKTAQVITMDYSALVGAGMRVTTLTLGIAADDFQFPVWGNPFTAWINGVTNARLTATLNLLSQTGPRTQFFSLGIAPDTLLDSHVLTLKIDEGGIGSDGWAIDFLTIGVTTALIVPEPSTVVGLAMGVVAGLGMMIQKRRAGAR